MSTPASKKFVSRWVQLSSQQEPKPTTQRKCLCPNGLEQTQEQGFECTNISPTLVLYTQIINNELLGLSKGKSTSIHYYMFTDGFGKRKKTELWKRCKTCCSQVLEVGRRAGGCITFRASLLEFHPTHPRMQLCEMNPISTSRNNDMTLCSNNLGRTRHARQKLHQKIYRWFEHLSDHPRIQTDNQHNNPYPGPLARYRRSHARNEAGPYLAAV